MVKNATNMVEKTLRGKRKTPVPSIVRLNGVFRTSSPKVEAMEAPRFLFSIGDSESADERNNHVENEGEGLKRPKKRFRIFEATEAPGEVLRKTKMRHCKLVSSHRAKFSTQVVKSTENIAESGFEEAREAMRSLLDGFLDTRDVSHGVKREIFEEFMKPVLYTRGACIVSEICSRVKNEATMPSENVQALRLCLLEIVRKASSSFDFSMDSEKRHMYLNSTHLLRFTIESVHYFYGNETDEQDNMTKRIGRCSESNFENMRMLVHGVPNEALSEAKDLMASLENVHPETDSIASLVDAVRLHGSTLCPSEFYKVVSSGQNRGIYQAAHVISDLMHVWKAWNAFREVYINMHAQAHGFFNTVRLCEQMMITHFFPKAIEASLDRLKRMEEPDLAWWREHAATDSLGVIPNVLYRLANNLGFQRQDTGQMELYLVLEAYVGYCTK